MTHNAIRFTTIALMLTCIAGCTSPTPRLPDTHYDIEAAIKPITYGSDVTIQLSKVDMRGIQSSRAVTIISDTDPIQLQEKRGHYWHSAPALLLKRTISETLNKASRDIRFGTSMTMQNPDYILDIDMRLFAFKPNRDAVIEMGYVIRNRDGEIVMHDVLYETARLNGASALDGLHGLQAALAQTLDALSHNLACHVIASEISKSSKC